MKKIYFPLIVFLVSFSSFSQGQARYKNIVFESIDTLMNIPYGQSVNIKNEMEKHSLDVYSPKNDSLKKRPLVVFVHGGGFVNGDKRTGYSRVVSENLSHRGFVVGSINYRLGIAEPKSDVSYFEAMIRAVQDAKAAIRFFRKNAENYGIDTSKIYIAGGSAGAMTALHLAYLDQKEVPTYIDLVKNGSMEGISGNEGFSSKIHGVVNFWGAMVNFNWLNTGDVPVFNVHGTTDKTVPFDSSFAYHNFKYGSQIIFERALSQGVPTGVKLSENLGHTLDNNKPAIISSLQEVGEWLYALVNRTKTTPNITRFEKEIKAHEVEDSKTNYSANAILFTGSSFIRLWKTIKKDLAPAEIIHHGFGGSNISEMAYYIPRIAYNHSFKAIYMYSGSNDLSVSKQDKSPLQILETYKYIVKLLRSKFPNTPIYYIAISPNERRWAVWDKIQETNELLKNYSSTKTNMYFVETTSALLGADGKYQPSLHVEDKLHFNEKGYEIWTKIMRKSIAEIK